MPIYEVEQYELHSSVHRIEAKSEAEAIAKLFDGNSEIVDDSPEYIGVADTYGIPADVNQELTDDLQRRGIVVRDHKIPSIRAVRRVE